MMKTLNTAPTLPQGAPNVKMYILANDYVYRMDYNLGPGPDMVPLMRWDTGLCKWLRFYIPDPYSP